MSAFTRISSLEFEKLAFDLNYVIPILITLILVYVFYKLSRPYDLLIDSYKYKWSMDNTNRSIEQPDAVFPNGWAPVLESCNLKRNQIKPVYCLGKDLVVYRGSSGKCYAFDAYCPHLGANLGVGGTVHGENIECPFHGWNFNQNGKCVSVPGIDEPPNAQLNKHEVVDVNNFILIWHHVNGQKSEWKPEKFKIMDTTTNYFGRSVHLINCYAQDIDENSSDVTHIPMLHNAPNYLGNLLIKPKYYDLAMKVVRLDYEPSWSTGTGSQKHMSYTKLITRIIVFGYTLMQFDFHYEATGIYHFNSELTYMGIQVYMAHNIITHGEMDHALTTRYYSNCGFLFNMLLSRPFIHLFAGQAERDALIWSNKKHLKHPIYAPHEKLLAKYRKWAATFYC